MLHQNVETFRDASWTIRFPVQTGFRPGPVNAVHDFKVGWLRWSAILDLGQSRL